MTSRNVGRPVDVPMKKEPARGPDPQDFLSELRRISKDLNSIVQNKGTAWAQTEAIRIGDENRLTQERQEKQELADRVSDLETRLGLIREAFGKLSDGGMSLFDYARETGEVLKP